MDGQLEIRDLTAQKRGMRHVRVLPKHDTGPLVTSGGDELSRHLRGHVPHHQQGDITLSQREAVGRDQGGERFHLLFQRHRCRVLPFAGAIAVFPNPHPATKIAVCQYLRIQKTPISRSFSSVE